ncbi:MAG: hypothetical protein GXO87_04995 [Chlorobi bacterium]|nr:hypothetical protein [Chlorobiota bacterium]
MNTAKTQHTFHIPVMGLSYTIDSPIKVAHLGISSVISIIEHNMIEKMREHYSKMFNFPFEPITPKTEDFRAERVTSYLDLVNDIVKMKFDKLKQSFIETRDELEKYFELLPSFSELKKHFEELIANNKSIQEIQRWLDENLTLGSIDVNIMTKLDGANYNGNEKLPTEQNDAHVALRGYANSSLESSIVLSAGMNPRLFSYMENFDDFYPDQNGNFKKKIIIKVSDYRSAFIQGKFFAKKGLWVSEYRVESGLNCGGHAFATDGYLLGPILHEFNKNRKTLFETTYAIFKDALTKKGKIVPAVIPSTKLSAQGGVGTAEEHNFLLEEYNVDSVGWGSPFLLVPEATTVDETTMRILSDAGEDDLYLSNASPLGVPFNNVKKSTKDIERMELIKTGQPGSACPKKILAFVTDYGDIPICTASKKYIDIKLAELKKENFSEAQYNREFSKITEKECLCNGLASSALLANNLNTLMEGEAVSVCPGPNMAYYSGKFSLLEMVQHIYGKVNILNTSNRPHMFIKELKMYVDYLKNKMDEAAFPFSDKQMKYFETFQTNLNDGIEYYKNLFAENKEALKENYEKLIDDLEAFEIQLKGFVALSA